MTVESKIVLRGEKCAKIILAISEMYGLALEEAMDIYYQSVTSELIEEGVADLHCRSEKYLAQCVMDEYMETKGENENPTESVDSENRNL